MNAEIKKVAVIGAGVIGASWAGLFLAHGYDVSVTDPAPQAETALRSHIASFWPALVQLTDAPEIIPYHRLVFSRDLGAAVHDVDFVQENGPENIAFKRDIFAQLDRLAPDHAILASSSSGFRIGDIQDVCQRPGRTLIAHPFNPPHLIPLIELVGGGATAAETIAQARSFYEAMGKHCIVLQKEVLGHVANRIQAAVFREVVHLVTEGVVSVEDADAAIRYGPGLRWSVMGQSMLFHLGGGEGGLGAMLDKLGPSIESWWDDLGQPRLDPATRAALLEGVALATKGQSMTDLTRQRDDMLVSRLVADRPAVAAT